MRLTPAVLCFLLACAPAGHSAFADEPPMTTDDARRDETVTDDYHGTPVADPYRWLEDPASDETRAWVSAQNAATRAALDGPVREAFRARLEQLVDYPRRSAPSHEGEVYVYSRNTGLQPQAVVYAGASADDEGKILFDPNAMSDDGTVALSGLTFTYDGKTVAYGVSEGGSDDKVVRFRDVATGDDLTDVLTGMRFGGLDFEPMDRGVWYGKYPDPDVRRDQKVYFHQLGTEQSDDTVVYERPDDPDLRFHPDVSDDGEWFFLYVSRGTDPKNGVRFRQICCDPHLFGYFQELFPPGDAEYAVVDNDGPIFYVYTDKGAPRRKLVAVDSQHQEEANWKTVLPETDDLLENVTMVNGQFVATYLRDGANAIRVFEKDGTFVREVGLPTLGTVGGIQGERKDAQMFFTFSSFTYPGTVYRYDLPTGELTKLEEPSVEFDPAAYETRQRFAASKDGTKVPVFVVHKKGLTLDGTNPTILYGYGGFGISMGPSFSASRLAWLEKGGVFAVALLRGGGEYGSDWHEAGKFGNKQNVFDDFIAASELLISDGYTSPKKLAIQGGSNGGLLVTATMLQRPDLFGAVVAQVPVTDMLRYQRFGTGRFWTAEWGDATESREAFDYLRAYSPLHNVKAGVAYPPVLVTTAEGDDRVVPAHAFKFVAELRHANPGGVALLRHDTKAGHGAGKPTAKVLDEAADTYAFLAGRLGMQTD